MLFLMRSPILFIPGLQFIINIHGQSPSHPFHDSTSWNLLHQCNTITWSYNWYPTNANSRHQLWICFIFLPSGFKCTTTHCCALMIYFFMNHQWSNSMNRLISSDQHKCFRRPDVNLPKVYKSAQKQSRLQNRKTSVNINNTERASLIFS